MPAVKLSAVIITYNEEKNIGRCLDSLKEVADEIVVVDSLSKDKTVSLASGRGARVIEQPFLGYIEQKNFALDRVTYDHVLSLDADESLSDELRQSIIRVKSSWSSDGYTMNRLSRYGERWIRVTKWYPDRKLRLWVRSKGRWGGEKPHERVLMEAGCNVTHLSGDLLHYAYDNAGQLLHKFNQYTDIFARENRFVKHSSVFKIIYKTAASFFSNYLIKRGFLGGYEGFVISYSNAVYSFYKYAKLFEANRSLNYSAVELKRLAPETLDQLGEYLIFSSEVRRHVSAAWKGRYLVGDGISCWKEDFRKAGLAGAELTEATIRSALDGLELTCVKV
jgi:glycosyltransferase involved in cell wall biosynthesis